MRRPPHEVDQRQSLDWLANLHGEAQSALESLSSAEKDAFVARLRKVIDRVACGPTKIARRGHVVADVDKVDEKHRALYDTRNHPHGAGTAIRNEIFAEIVAAYFEAEYAHETSPPGDLIHVTCTGYVSPSGAQRIVGRKGWGDITRVTHAYHMGCYAAFPAVRLAAGGLRFDDAHAPSAADRRVDIVHTELCTLHLDPGNHSLEQLVVQSLFADGFIRYSLREGESEPGLRVLALSERILPDSAESMSWALSDTGMRMVLGTDVPQRIAATLRGFVLELYRKAGLSIGDMLARTVFAVHPGGPKIIDAVRDVLELTDAQVQTSRDVLFDYGNMSSATLPHVWMRLVADPKIPAETPILSLAFGPGLTICGGLFQMAR
jgi:predicted naringenin-chalcone synthase